MKTFARVFVAAIALHGVANAAQYECSSFNRKDGRAAVEYKSRDVPIVVAYYHSQRHHDSRWRLIEAALSATKLSVIPRTAFSIQNPAGRVIPLGTQRRFAREVSRRVLKRTPAPAFSAQIRTQFRLSNSRRQDALAARFTA